MFKKDSEQNNPTEVVLQYKNVRYSDNISNKCLIPTPLSLECLKNNNQNTENACEEPRPISCPVCAKIIAMNSILVHFYFDHSKVLKLRLPFSKRQRILVKAADLSYETKCIAVIYLEEANSTDNIKPKPSQTNKMRPFLLLATKMSTGSSKNAGEAEEKCIEENVTQGQISHRFDKNDVLLFWTCKTDNYELISNVKLARKDSKLSFSYTGEAVHIREKQNAINVYQHAECLIVRGVVANSLLDKDNKMHVFVRCLR